MENKIDLNQIDTSFSGIVDLIQDDKNKGIKLLMELILAKETLEVEIKGLTNKLCHKNYGIKNINAYLKLEHPVFIKDDEGSIIRLDKDSFSYEELLTLDDT